MHAPLVRPPKAHPRGWCRRACRFAVRCAALALVLTASLPAQVTLTGTSYTQDFNGIGTALPTGWAVATGASAGSLGTAASLTTAATAWSSATGQFANYASGTTGSSATTTTQSAATDRALGLRQTGTFGDPGAAFEFNFSSTGKTLAGLTLDLMMLSVQTRSTTWTVQYGLGASPTSFTGFSGGTWSDPGTFGTTSFNFASDTTALAALSNQAAAWIRVVALATSTGSSSRDTVGLDSFVLAYTGADVVTNVSRGAGTTFTPTSFGGNVFTALNTAVFDGTAATVTLNVAVSATALSFTTDGYTLAGGVGDSVTVATIDVATGISATISGDVAGGTGVTKAGAGTLIFTGAKSYTGTTTVSAGTLQGDTGSLGNKDLSIGTVATLVFNQTTDGTYSGSSLNLLGTLVKQGSGLLTLATAVTGGGGVTVQTGTLRAAVDNVATGLVTVLGSATFDLDGNIATVTGLALTGGAATTGAGTLSLSGNVTTGASGVAAVISGNLALGSAQRTFTVADGGAATDLLITANTTGSTRLIKQGLGTLELAGSNTMANGVRLGGTFTTPVEAGTLVVSNDNALGNTGATTATQLQFNSGTLVANGTRNLPVGVQVGWVVGNTVSQPTFTGAGFTFTGTSVFAIASAPGGSVFAATFNTTVTLAGSLTTTTTSGTSLLVGGTGTLDINGAPSTVATPFTAQDSLTVNFNVPAAGKLTFGPVASLAMTGTAAINATVANAGTLQFGNSSATGLNLASLTLHDGAALTFSLSTPLNAAASTIFIAGSLIGDAGGTVTLNVIDPDANLQAGTTYRLFSFVGATLQNINSGTFALGTLNVAGDLGLTLIYSSTALDLAVEAIPEPATNAAIFGALALAAATGRRRRTRHSAPPRG